MIIEHLKVDFQFCDERGELIQLFRRGYSQANVIFTKKDVFRGGHYHKLNTEAFYLISGKCRVTVSVDGETESEEFGAGDYFRIGPNVMHSFEYLEDTVMVSMYSLGVELEDGKMDMYVN